MKSLKRAGVLAMSVAVFAGCESDPAGPQGPTLADMTAEMPDLENVSAHMQSANMMGKLSEDGPYTFFAPNREAFRSLPEGLLERLESNPGFLREILAYHLAVGAFAAADLEDGDELPTVQGSTLRVTVGEDGVFINDAEVVRADIRGRNGIIHVVNRLLIPESELDNIVETAVKAGVFNTLLAAAEAAGLVDLLANEGPLTVFAPTDDAFAKLPEGTVEALLNDLDALRDILAYHVVLGKALSTDLSDGQQIRTLQGSNVVVSINENGVYINQSQVGPADVMASNGVIHVIDAVLIPPMLKNIVETADEAGIFKTLLAAAQAAGLADFLASEDPLTVFAPTDDAFAKLPEGTVDALLNDIPALTEILTYHVVKAKALSSDLSDGQAIETVNGKNVVVSIDENGIFINASKVGPADVMASNGVIHVIDAVLIPPKNLVEVAEEAGAFGTLLTALEATGLKDAIANGGPYTVFAPPDDAFNNLPAGLLSYLVANPVILAEVLKYHVVDGIVTAEDLLECDDLVTLQGSKVSVNVVADKIFVNGRAVTTADIGASNGVIHVIDGVLIPPKS